jgi:hypothetical protein
MQTMYCIIWNKNNIWELFTNQVFILESEAIDFAQRSNIKYKKKKVEWRVADAAEWF